MDTRSDQGGERTEALADVRMCLCTSYLSAMNLHISFSLDCSKKSKTVPLGEEQCFIPELNRQPCLPGHQGRRYN